MKDPYDDAHERRAVVYDSKNGSGLRPLAVKDAADISNQRPPRGSWVHTAGGSGPQIAARVRKRSLPNL